MEFLLWKLLLGQQRALRAGSESAASYRNLRSEEVGLFARDYSAPDTAAVIKRVRTAMVGCLNEAALR